MTQPFRETDLEQRSREANAKFETTFSFRPDCNQIKTLAELSLKRKEIAERDDVFFAWQCLSLLLDSHVSLDLVIRDNRDLMALIRVLHCFFYSVEDVENS